MIKFCPVIIVFLFAIAIFEIKKRMILMKSRLAALLVLLALVVVSSCQTYKTCATYSKNTQPVHQQEAAGAKRV